MRRLYREGCADFTIKHRHKDLLRRHDRTLGYTNIYSAMFVAEGGTMSNFVGLRSQHAACSARSTPTAARTISTRPKRGDRVDSRHATKVGRAMKQLGIRHFTQGSWTDGTRVRDAAASGAGVAPGRDAYMEAGTAYLRTAYVPADNERFCKPATEPGSAFVVCPEIALEEVL